jgi:toxin ParE1/3/4
MTGFRLSVQAARDIEQIWVYIAEDNLRAASKVRIRLLKSIRQLARHPRLGHRRSDLTDRPLLFWPEGRYLIVYDPNPQPIEIVRVIHGSRDAAALLGGESAIL